MSWHVFESLEDGTVVALETLATWWLQVLRL